MLGPKFGNHGGLKFFLKTFLEVFSRKPKSAVILKILQILKSSTTEL